MANLGKQVCTISIMFPVESDEQAISCKKKVEDALSDIADARVQFSLMTTPLRKGDLALPT